MAKAAPDTQRNPFGIVPRALFGLRLKDGSRLDAVDFAVFTALATFADADRYAYPSIDTLAKMINRKRRNTIDHLRRLEEAGAITSTARYDDHDRQTSNGYVLDLMKSSTRGAAKRTPEDAAQCTGEDAAGCIQTVPVITKPDEQKEVGAASAPLAKNDLVLFQHDPSVEMSSGRRLTFTQASAAGDLKGRCIDMARHKFTNHDWPDIEWGLLWEEFSHYWGVEASRKTKIDWPIAFYNRAVERRNFTAYRKGDTDARRGHTGNKVFAEAARDLVIKYDAEDAASRDPTSADNNSPVR